MRLTRRRALLLVPGISTAAIGGAAARAPRLLRLAWDGEPPGRELPEQARVIAHPGADLDAASAAHALLQAPPVAVLPVGTPLLLLSSGPPLDAPDRVAIGAWQSDGHGQLSLGVRHTQVRAEGRVLERNLRWRPVLQAELPDGIAAGRYQIVIEWRPEGDAPAMTQRLTLELHAQR